jgi:ubiquitin carboxyl-terminal hydrolase 10
MRDAPNAREDWQEVDSRGKHCVTRRIVSQDTTTNGTPIQNLALGMCRSSLRSGSGEISATLQPFFTLQLDIQHPEITSLNEALLKNFDSEEIEGYKNQKTNQVVKATRSLSLEELPAILILHMKRFVYDAKTGGVQKTLKPVEFSVDLEIPKTVLSSETRNKFTSRQRMYKLFAVVCHNGREATKGHYVTDIYHTGYGCWLHCDDALVTETAQESVLTPSQTSTPYILFYRRNDTIVGQEKKEAKPPK